MRQRFVSAGLFVAALSGIACSGNDSAGAGSGGATGGNSSGGATATGGSAGAGTGGKSSATGGSGPGFLNAAVCGQRGSGTANATTYDGTAEFYIIGEAGLGTDVCSVRFDVKRVGPAEHPDGCADCVWTHLVTYSNPTLVTNTDGACDANDSAPALDAMGTQITGTRIALGFSKLAGHGDELMKYDDAMKKWVGIGRASWDEASGDLGYDIRTGTCSYGH